MNKLHVTLSKYHFERKIIIFFLFFCTVMVLVNVCPRSKHDVMQASKRLRCGDDIYGNNQYLCLPNKNKTSLVEICFQGVMGIVEKGKLQI